MPSPSRTTFVLLWAAVVIGALVIVACAFAALDEAEFRLLEKQGRDLTAPACRVEVVQGAEAEAHGVHALHGLRLGGVNA